MTVYGEMKIALSTILPPRTREQAEVESWLRQLERRFGPALYGGTMLYKRLAPAEQAEVDRKSKMIADRYARMFTDAIG